MGSCIKTKAMWFEVDPPTKGCRSAWETWTWDSCIQRPLWFLRCPPASTHKLCSRSSASWLSSFRTSEIASPRQVGCLETAMLASYRFLGTRFLMYFLETEGLLSRAFLHCAEFSRICLDSPFCILIKQYSIS